MFPTPRKSRHVYTSEEYFVQQVPMHIKSIAVPTDSQVVLVTVDLGVPGAIGEFQFTVDQARQLGYDLLGAAHSIEPQFGRNAQGGRHFTLDADTIRFSAAGHSMGG